MRIFRARHFIFAVNAYLATALALYVACALDLPNPRCAMLTFFRPTDAIVGLSFMRATSTSVSFLPHRATRRRLATDAEKLLKAGSTNYLTVLDANLALITADQSLAMLDGKIVDDQITLFLAQGVGIAAAVGA